MASASGDSSGSDGGLGQRRRRPLSSRSFAFNLLIFTIAGLSLYSQPGALAKISEEDTVLLSEQQAVQSGVAKLPCDISPPLQGDKVHLVIWSKVGVVKPIYTFDARLNSIDQAKHWADETLGGRASFHYMEDPSKLKVENVRDSDSGLYKCRVDFQKSPTRNSLVNLTVIIPPEKLSILDDQGTHIPHYILGPYNEGASIDITCVATGGRPTPRVTWWQENALLDDTFEVLPERRVRNVLRLERLQRKHLHTVFTCQASNNNLVAPISSAVTLDMNLRPLIVRLKGENKPLSADNTYELACEVWGSRPTPTITWWKGSIPMRNTREIIDPDGNKTTSILTFVPTIDDGGKYLSCRAVQSLIPDSGLEDGWKLDIYHVPVVTLELGSNLNGSTIREGVDVYFECNIKSNPWVYKVSWRHNGKLLYNNFEAGTIVSNQSLVLQGVTRARAGLYTCVGSNHEGDGESNPVHLDVKFAPVCRPGQAKVHGVARQETARITCELEANPNDVQFTWKFNNSAEAVDIPQSHVAVDRARSIAAYTPMTELDYGTLMCWGRNEIGMQKEPCVYFINPAGKPDALHNCSILNQTADSLQVECVEGFDGGLTQEFVMEVYDSTNKKLVTNVTSRSPYFAVGGLESGIGFEIVLFATNKKGRSDVTPLQAYTLKSEKHTGGSEKPQPPQNCSVSHHSSKAVRVSCEPPDDNGENLTTFMMQVFDADTRHLLGSTTSLTADKLEIWDLPRETDGSLILSIRTIAARSTSEAVILYSAPATSLEQQRGANTPVLLQITPILGALIGVVTALVMVAIVIVVVIRLRGHGDQDDKDCSDGGSGTGNRRTVASGGDKASTEPLNKELDDSIDSLEEKNPDIIPQANGDDDYQDEEKAFERLNNAPPRIYSRLQSPNTIGRNSPYDTSFHGPKSNDEITYAELSLSTNKTLPHVLYNSHPAHQKTIPMSLIRRPDMPTMYAHIDVSKRPTLPTIQPLSPPHSTALPLLHHQHHSLQSTAYLPRPSHEEMHLLHDAPVTAETPLINSRESTVSTLQPLLEATASRTPPSQHPPRTVTATRF